MDEGIISIHSPSLKTALTLTAADRRWADFLTQTINETWDPAHPEQPKTHGYVGSEEFIRLQFEEYLLALLSSTNHRLHTQPQSPGRPVDTRNKGPLDAEADSTPDFNVDFIAHWQTTRNYALFQRLTSDSLLFSIVEPRHPYAGGLTIDDIQRRLAQQVSELHLDERVREGREVLNKTLASGQKRVSSAFNSFWADIEALREAQRKKNEEKAGNTDRISSDERNNSNEYAQSVRGDASPSENNNDNNNNNNNTSSAFSWFGGRRAPAVDISQAQATVNVAGQKAGAYISSWGAWASERRKEWQEKRSNAETNSNNNAIPSPRISSEAMLKRSSTLPSVSEKIESTDRPTPGTHDDGDLKYGKKYDQYTESSPFSRENEDIPSPTSSAAAAAAAGGGGTAPTLGRSMSRRKRWSSVLRMKDHHHHHNRSDSETESSASRKGSLDIPRRGSAASAVSILPGSTAAIGDSGNISKSPLGQKQLVREDDDNNHEDPKSSSSSFFDGKNGSDSIPDGAEQPETTNHDPVSLPTETKESSDIHNSSHDVEGSDGIVQKTTKAPDDAIPKIEA